MGQATGTPIVTNPDCAVKTIGVRVAPFCEHNSGTPSQAVTKPAGRPGTRPYVSWGAGVLSRANRRGTQAAGSPRRSKGTFSVSAAVVLLRRKHAIPQPIWRLPPHLILEFAARRARTARVLANRPRSCGVDTHRVAFCTFSKRIPKTCTGRQQNPSMTRNREMVPHIGLKFPSPKAVTSPPTPRTLAFCINHSKESFSAFSWASANLIQTNDLILFIYVHPNHHTATPYIVSKNITSRYEEKCRKNNFNYELVITDGDPANRIAEITATRRCDLCVLGMKTRSALMRAVHGCFATHIASTCSCPVMIVKMPKVHDALQTRTDLKFEQICPPA